MRIRDTLVLVSESSQIRAELRGIFEENYNILEASNAKQLSLFLDQNIAVIAAVLIDIKMTDGDVPAIAPVCAKYSEPKLPVIAIVSDKSHRDVKLAVELGACEVVTYPFQSALVKLRVVNVVSHYSASSNMQDLVADRIDAIHRSYEAMVDSLSALIEHRSVESGQHVMRIRRFTKILLEEVQNACPEYSLDGSSIQAISSASALHDIGKIAIPDAILNKPGRLTDEEFEIMKTHTVTGSAILETFKNAGEDDYMRYAYNICRYHHERWDGRGYPDGISGDEIPICAQVVGLVDAYDALTTDRVYKKAIPYLDASNMIINGECGAFSPKLLECFKNVRGIFEELARSYADGYSPSDDSITVPLPPPKKASRDSLQSAIAKYRALLHHFDIAAMEIDFDTGVYHLIYDPYLDFDVIRSKNNFSDAMHNFAERCIHPDDRSIVLDKFDEYFERFFASGQRKSVRYYRTRGSDGIYHNCEATLIRIKTDDENDRRALGIWRRTQNEENSEIKHAAGWSEFVIEPFCRFDANLTLENDVDRLCNMLGYTVDEFNEKFGGGLANLIVPDRKDAVLEKMSKQLDNSKITEMIVPFLCKNGDITHFFVRGRLVVDKNGTEKIFGIFCNCDGLREEHETMISSLSLYRTIVDNTGDILFEWDIDSDKLTCSPKWKERFGYESISENATENINARSHIHPDDIATFNAKMHEIKRSSNIPFIEFTLRFADITGKYLWNRIRATAMRDEKGRTVKIIGLIVDIDKDYRKSQSILDKAEKDSLTGLLNKEATREHVEKILKSGADKCCAMIIIDLDNFKDINDNFGHLFGDTVLVSLSDEIMGMFREGDIVGRIGGDEFLVFVNNVSSDNIIIDRCNELIENIRNLYDDKGAGFSLSCSVGVSVTPKDAHDYAGLFEKADIALYHSKNNGKGVCTVYEAAMERPDYNSSVTARIDSDNSIGLANNSLIEYVFQRLYDTNDIEATINSVFEFVGRQMNVSRLYVFENNDDNTTCSNTFEWCNEGITPEKDWLQDIEYESMIPDYDKLFNERGIFYCADVSRLPKHIRDILEPQGVLSMLQCAIRDKGVFRGYIGIDECKKKRMWTKEQIDMLTFLSQLVSVFLLKKRAQERTDAINNDLRRVLESQYAWVYVVGHENYELRFLNGRVLEVAPNAKKGEHCYKALMGRDAPCEECPIKTGGTCRISNTYLGLEVDATVAPIHWDGKKEWLLTCRQADK